MNINNNNSPFEPIKGHLKEPLDCVVYSHYPSNDSCNNVYIAAAYLAIILLSLLAYLRE